MKKIIETALPLAEINEAAIGDKVRKGHPGNMHLWWNRSPIASSAALLYAALTDFDEISGENEQQERIKGLAENNPSCYEQAKQLLIQLDMPTVVDSFSGFGGLALAAEKLGLKTEAFDLNSVAALLTKAAVEIPGRFPDCVAVHPDADGTRKGPEAMAEDVVLYGRQLLEKAKQKLAQMYPDENGRQPTAWLWVRNVECPNPACRCRMPLSGSYVLAKNKGYAHWAEPVVESGCVRFQVHKGDCPADRETNKIGSMGAKFQCPACGEITTDAYVKKMGKAHRLGTQMMAVFQASEGDRVFLESSEIQREAAEVPAPDDLPTGKIAENSRWFSPPGFGLADYTDLYTNRQLHMLTTFCDLIQEVIDKAASDALSMRMSESGGGLDNGGTGALAYGQAIGTYLAIAVSKMANYHSAVCTWDNRNGSGRAAFTRQAIPMVWTFVEENPFAAITGNFESLLESVAESVASLPIGAETKVGQADAISRDYPPGSILFAELPYYDNVGYADLSDYFYIWLRRCLKGVFPAIFANIVTSKEELSSIPEHYAGDSGKAIEAYEQKCKELFRNFAKSASLEYPSVIFYEYAKADELAMYSNSTGSEQDSRLAILLQSVLDAGFAVTALWPVRTENHNARFNSIRIAVVFRTSKADAVQTTRRGFINSLKRELPDRLRQLRNGHMPAEDELISCIGQGLAVFSEFQSVLNADGSNMRVHDALQLIYQECIDDIEQRKAAEEEAAADTKEE